MVELRGLLQEALDSHKLPASPAISSASETYSDTPAALRSDPPVSSQKPPTLRVDAELKFLLQALPTKADIKALIDRLEETHRQELQDIKKDVQSFQTGSPWGNPR